MSVDLDELDRLRAAATPAPWGMERQTNEHFVATNHSLRLGSERSPTWYVAAIEGRGYLADANAALIVALVNAYPALAAELRELREKVALPTTPAAPARTNSCNRHDDCAAATTAFTAKYGRPPNLGSGFHCYSEDCEDCFGC